MDGCFDMMHYGHANALRQVHLCLIIGCPGHLSSCKIVEASQY